MKLAIVFFLIYAIVGCQRFLPAQAPCGFVMNPDQQRITWGLRLPVQLNVDSSVPAEAYPALNRAIYEFNSSMNREMFVVNRYGSSIQWTESIDGFSVIYWFNVWNPNMYTQEGVTSIRSSGSDLIEADMRINAKDNAYSFGDSLNNYSVDLQSLFTHELGHVLGLAHTDVVGSIMNPILEAGQSRRVLGAQDIENLHCAY